MNIRQKQVTKLTKVNFIDEYAISSGMYFIAMPDDISDAQQIAKILEKEYKCGQV